MSKSNQNENWLVNPTFLIILSLTFLGSLVFMFGHAKPNHMITKNGIHRTGLTAMFTGNSIQGSANQKIDNGCICAQGMNMLYIGMPTDVNIAIPGVSSSRVNATISQGTIKKDGDRFLVSVTRPGNATITATGGGKQYQMVFRVRRLPKPEAKWGTLDNDGLPKPRVAIAAQTKIIASLGEGFAFEDVRYQVTRYQLIFQPKKGDARVQRVNGNSIPGWIKSMIMNASRGDRILVDQIRASGPGGERPLSPILIDLR